MRNVANYRSPEWERANIAELCRSRGVAVVVYDFIAHNMSHSAARAALLAMPVIA